MDNSEYTQIYQKLQKQHQELLQGLQKTDETSQKFEKYHHKQIAIINNLLLNIIKLQTLNIKIKKEMEND